MSAAEVTFAAVYPELTAGPEPSTRTIRAAFDAILAGRWTTAEIAGFVVALRMRGESPAAITQAALSLRGAMIPVEHGLDATLDTCGTGGDGHGTLNVSTVAAIVAASLGVPVAKHGNRAVSSRAGSAEVVEALGVPLDVPTDRQAGLLRSCGIAFLFAPAHHPAMRHAAPARRELGIRTIFNILGPLANPARATHQLIGAFDDSLRPAMAETLRTLGTRRAWIVRGAEGIDEVSPSGPTRVTEVDEGELRERVITPEDFGLPRAPAGSLEGGDARANAAAIRAILSGQPHPARSAIVLNTAAALAVALGGDWREAAREADRAITSGRALAKLEEWRAAASRARSHEPPG